MFAFLLCLKTSLNATLLGMVIGRRLPFPVVEGCDLIDIDTDMGDFGSLI